MSTSQQDSPLLPELVSDESCTRLHTIRKLDRRVLSLTVGVAFIAYVDRSNIGFAAKTLCNDLQINHEQYGLGVTLFYSGYVLTQMVSSVAVKHLGAPTWISIIMFGWGCAAGAMAFITSKIHFYVLRFLLGLTEGGTFPAIFYYLALFYPRDYMTGAFAMLMAAMLLSMPVAAPTAAGLLSLEGMFGVEGWRILFFVEGAVPIVYSIAHFVLLPATPEKASFLSDEEKAWIMAENSAAHTSNGQSVWQEIFAVLKIRVWWLISFGFMLDFGISNSLMFWVTLLVDDMLYGNEVGVGDGPKTCGSKHGSRITAVLLTMIPYVVACLACLATRFFLDNGRIHDRAHFGVATKIATAVLLLAWVGFRELSFASGFIALVAAIGCFYLAAGVYIGLLVDQVDNTLTRTASAMFNNLSSFGSVIFPQIIAKLLDDFGYGATISFCASVIFLCGLVYSFVRDPSAPKRNCHETRLRRS